MPSVKGKFASKLVGLRGEKSLYQLAEECGIPRSMLFRYENGERLPTAPFMERLAAAYQVDLYELKKAFFEDLYPENSKDRDFLFRWVKEISGGTT